MRQIQPRGKRHRMKTVLSASRRTDLVASYPDRFVEVLKQYPPGEIHSIVIWTKNAVNLIQHSKLKAALLEYDQLFVHFSITGMGGSLLEPGIPETEESLSLLPELVRIVGCPERISIRFDPVVNLWIEGKRYSNIERFPQIAEAAAENSIRRITTSWMADYKKVIRRLEKHNIAIAEYNREKQIEYLQNECAQRGLELHGCCVEGLPVSRCIDGYLLQALHPNNERCSLARDSSQRPLCGCTKSKDVGWYSQSCIGGCLYCYANPAVSSTRETVAISR